MTGIDTASKRTPPRLLHLFSWQYIFPTLMLGGGITLHAVETYITATLLPSIVRDIGGLPLFAWATTLYVAASVLGSIFIAVRPASITLNRCYVLGAGLFALGSLVCAIAPGMEIVLLGRTVQGLGAGLLVALGYSFIRYVFPEELWRTASTLYAAVWGMATFLGPSIGGVFANGSLWREAFLLLVPIAAAMSLAAPRLLPAGSEERPQTRAPFPQILLIIGAVLVVSFAGSVGTARTAILLAAVATAAILVMLSVERASSSRLLPSGTIRFASPLARVYLIMLLMLVGLAPDIYIPFFLQELHGVTPLFSGYLVALLALGWTASAFLTAGLSGKAAIRSIVAGTLTEGLATAALAALLARHNPEAGYALLTAVTIGIFAMGFGVGLGWAHLVTLVLKHAPKGENDKASAAITTMQALGTAFGAALAGAIVNAAGLIEPGGLSGTLDAAFWLCALLALPGLIALCLALTLNAGEN